VTHDLARKNPWAVVAGGVALGFAASRILKASSSERYQARSAPRPGATPPDTATPDRALPRQTQPGDTLRVGEPRFGTPGAV
jgi:hypothetical protein